MTEFDDLDEFTLAPDRVRSARRIRCGKKRATTALTESRAKPRWLRQLRAEKRWDRKWKAER